MGVWGQIGRARPALRAAGAGLLLATGAIHLDLYLTGYSSVPVIGWMFLLQVVAAFALAAVVAATGSRLAAAAGAGFALATLGGYLLSVWVGLFGFTEVRTTAGIMAGVVEVAAAAALTALAVAPGGRAARPASASRLTTRPFAVAGLVVGVSALAVAMLAAAGVLAAGGPAVGGPGASALRTARIGGATVLIDGRGFTLYWFAPDTPTTSKCVGACAAYWPPTPGGAAAAAGAPGTFGEITRPDGSTQETYDGHPLYTYVGDTAPGQARGDGLNLNGGLWHEAVVSR